MNEKLEKNILAKLNARRKMLTYCTLAILTGSVVKVTNTIDTAIFLQLIPITTLLKDNFSITNKIRLW
jgi:hypothetical protein